MAVARLCETGTEGQSSIVRENLVIHTEQLQWFAIRVRPGREKLASSLLRAKGYEDFLPLYRATSQWSDRIKELERALFPAYLFCRLDPIHRLPILQTPWVNSIVSFGGIPIPIADPEIEAVRAIVQSGRRAAPWPFMQPGCRVRLNAGPFRGIEGSLVEVKNECRLVVAVSLLQRAVAVEIEREWAEPIRMPSARSGPTSRAQ